MADRQTDGLTDGIAVASTALAMRALRRAVKAAISSNMSSTRLHNMANFGPLAAEIGSVVWDTQANFNGFRVLAALALQQWRQPNFAALNRGRHLYLPGAAIMLGIGPHSSFYELIVYEKRIPEYIRAAL